ncbi:MAG: PAS domain S-box protein [Acidobacteriota bacterium]|nr:PAS domain S-box protein [Acidobacteriota bacterium]
MDDPQPAAHRSESIPSRQASDERYHTLFNFAPDGIIISDREGRYLDANPSVCRMLGYSHDELVGKSASDIVMPSEMDHIDPALATIHGPSAYRREWQFRRKDGSTLSADVMATVMPDGNLLAMFRDLTERDAWQGRFHQAQKMEAIGRLAGGVAHDFNNLLTVMLGFCEMLLEGQRQTGHDRISIEQIQRAATRAAELTRQLLAFSRQETTELTIGDAVEVPAPAAASLNGTEVVLVVEDADILRDLTRRLLERRGYTVLVAASAAEAIHQFDEHPAIQLILTDVVMPGMSGPALTQLLLERRPGLKVIYMSGYTDDAIVQHGGLKPGIAFLHKPFTANAIARKLRETLDVP